MEYKKLLELKKFMLLLFLIGDRNVPIWFGVINELAVNILIETCVINFYLCGISPSSCEMTLRNSRLLNHRDGTQKEKINELNCRK